MKSVFIIILFCVSFSVIGQTLEDSLTIPVEINSHRTIEEGVVSISRTEFLTLAGAFDDPARLLIKYPGISTANDQANSVIYHGLPSQYHQWQLYGARILNPNHQSNAGTVTDNPSRSSGGVNMMSGQVIGEMNFYGNPSGKCLNSLAGNSDIKLRDPYRDNLQFNLSLIGLEAGVDQTFGKENNQSLMLNYRYSTVGLLTDLGLDFGGEEIKYSDFTTKYSIDTDKAGHYDIYAIYGRSTNDKDLISDPDLFKDYQQVNYEKSNLTAGVHHSKDLFKSSKFLQTLNFSTVSDRRRAQEYYTGLEESVQDYSLDESLLSYSALFSKQTEKNKIGFEVSANYLSTGFSSLFRLPEEELSYESNPKRAEFIISSFFKKDKNEGWSYEAKPGLIYNTDNDKPFIIGHLSLRYSQNKVSASISASLARQEILPEWNEVFQVGILSSLQMPIYSAKMDFQWSNLIVSPYFTKIEGFKTHQTQSQIFNIFDNAGYYFDNIEYNIVSNISTAFGVDVSYKFSVLGIEVSPSFSLMNSSQSGDSKRLPFDFGHLANIQASKKWKLARSRYIGVSLAFHHRGGARQQLINEDNSFAQGLSRFYYGSENQIQLSNYYRLDSRIYYIVKKGKYKSTISLDIQNVTNRENDAYYYYEPTTENSRLQKQLGLLPVLSWRLSI